MHFLKVANPSSGEVDLVEELRRALFAEQKVLWLLPGGSNIPTSVTVMQQLNDAPLKNLTIMLGDERYGQVDHPDSNARQLADNGFDPGEATFVPVLKNTDLNDTVSDYAQAYERLSTAADYIIGQFGIGADGHIAGILPGSIAIDSPDLVVAYQGGGFTRITLTPKALSKVNMAYVFAWGESKKAALTRLRDDSAPLNEQPCQLLKKLPDVYVYNDQIGDK